MNSPILHLTTLFVILNVGFCNSCKDGGKDETVCNPANTAYFPQDAKDRFFFKEGTWWVYENVDTKERDSVWVQSANLSSWSADNEVDGFIKNKCYEAGGVDIYGLKNGATTWLSQWSFSHLHAKAGINPAQEHFTLDENIPQPNTLIPIYRFEIKSGKYETPNQEGAEITFEDSIEVNGKTYNNVLHYLYPNTVSPYDYSREVWYAKHVGTIKYVSRDSYTWVLIKSKIIQ